LDPVVNTVELRGRSSSGTEERYARFVLLPDGSVVVVGLRRGGKDLAEELTRHGVPGPIDGMITRADGLAFLNALREAFRGSRLWATPVVQMTAREALQSAEP
jgi:hypothetical protein